LILRCRLCIAYSLIVGNISKYAHLICRCSKYASVGACYYSCMCVCECSLPVKYLS
jgi:hypothetical protein